jgi:hypothetical protein
MDFVTRVTTESNSDFVPVSERVATFDNDGTLWAEQPLYFQLAFALDEVRARAAQHPEWKTTPSFDAVLSGDTAALRRPARRALSTSWPRPMRA